MTGAYSSKLLQITAKELFGHVKQKVKDFLPESYIGKMDEFIHLLPDVIHEFEVDDFVHYTVKRMELESPVTLHSWVKYKYINPNKSFLPEDPQTRTKDVGELQDDDWRNLLKTIVERRSDGQSYEAATQPSTWKAIFRLATALTLYKLATQNAEKLKLSIAPAELGENGSAVEVAPARELPAAEARDVSAIIEPVVDVVLLSPDRQLAILQAAAAILARSPKARKSFGAMIRTNQKMLDTLKP